jgi:hypothetical protein
MDYASGSVPADAASANRRFAPLAAAGVVAIAAALTAYLVRPAGRAGAPAEKRHALVAYLREHLSGSDIAIQVVRSLAATYDGTLDGQLLRYLAGEFERDRESVRSLLTQLGASPRSLKRVTGYASGALARTVAGGAPGDLSLLRTFEALAIGVQGKRCMWRTLQGIGAGGSADGVTFLELEANAVRQWEAIEERRRALAAITFPTLRSDSDARVV